MTSRIFSQDAVYFVREATDSANPSKYWKMIEPHAGCEWVRMMRDN